MTHDHHEADEHAIATQEAYELGWRQHGDYHAKRVEDALLAVADELHELRLAVTE